MTTLTLNGAGLNFTAPYSVSTSYSQQYWGGYWIGAYFNINWLGQNLTYSIGNILPSGGVITGINATSVTTGQAYFSVDDTNYTIVSSDIGINADVMALNIVSKSSTPVYISGGSGNDLLAWYTGLSNSPTIINGSAGSDTLELSREFSNYIFTKYSTTTNTVSIHSIAANVDANLSSIESFKFLDKTLNFSNLTNTITASEVIDTSKANVTYSLASLPPSINEGSTATFTLTTTNVASGTSLPYTLSGSINATDISSGSLSGYLIVNASGVATMQVSLLSDNLTEGPETLTITVGGTSASTVINDTSKVIVPPVTGTAAKDSITNLPVSQSIDGGAGTDTLIHTSNSYEVVISKSGASTKLTNPVTGEEDTLINVERIKFADTSIALDTSGVGGQAYRIYQAAFKRTPDAAGLGYWIGGMDSGASLKSVAGGFISSAEFKALYGTSPTNTQIVTKFYENALNRAPDLGGLNYWVGLLNSGQGTVEDLLIAFSESPENQSAVIGVIEKGMRYTPNVSPTFTMFASATSVNEGGVATFTLRTTNVAAGSSIPYTLSGISAADVFGGSLSGNAVVNSSGVATISVALLNDLLTEGAETLKVTAGSATASIVVNDTSTAEIIDTTPGRGFVVAVGVVVGGDGG